MKIVNKRKFIRSTSITIGLIVFLILILSNISFSHTEIIYKKISINYGDTLWSIAKCEQNTNVYFENKNIQDIIYQIKKVNNLTNSNLNVGDILTIPTI